MNPLPRWLRPVVLVVLLAGVGGLLFLSAMDRDLNHDEHQFVAPGVLMAREGLLPYRDFPIFHLPNLAFIYAGLDRLTQQPMLSAKLLGVLASTAAAGLIFLAGTARRAESPLLHRHLYYAVAAVILLLADQLFTFTIGKTWNHEFPAFLLLAGIAAQVRAIETARVRWFALSGLCVGVAVGTRLTYAPVALAFPAILWLLPLPQRVRLSGAAVWVGACGLAFLPSLYCLWVAGDRFIFDNLRFPRLRLADLSDTRVQKTIAWWRKVRFFFKQIVPGSLPLIGTFFLAWIGWRKEEWQRWGRAVKEFFREPRLAALLSMWSKATSWASRNTGLALTLVVLPLAILGCCLPSRYQYQHFYVFAPLLAMAVAYGTRAWVSTGPWRPMLLCAATLFAMSPLNSDSSKRAGGIRAYKEAPAMLRPQNWFTRKLRADYSFVSTVPGRILTLAPIGVLEAGGRIYPEFAPGPFAWRTASLLSSELRKKYGLIAPEDLEAFLATDPPAGILTGVEDEVLEKPFITYAMSHSYVATQVARRRTLWVPR